MPKPAQPNPEELSAELRLLKAFRATAIATAGGSRVSPAERIAGAKLAGRLEEEIAALESQLPRIEEKHAA